MVESLIEHYRKHQFMPTACDVSSKEGFQNHYQKRKNLLINKLYLPDLIWQTARVLEVGCGSGENSLIYALLGAKMTFIEPLTLSIERLESLFTKYNVADRIENIYLSTIEEISMQDKFDIVLAEGFITTLTNKKDVIQKLFNYVAEGGLLVISTNDATGNIIESFRATIAQLYCRKHNITGIDEKVEAVRPFFEDDFESIPHSRPFELWAKDVLFYPLSPNEYYYDFDEIVDDLSALSPKFYSSWPSYHPFNDLKWHKHIPDDNLEMEKIRHGYYLRRPSFVFGEVKTEKQAMEFALNNYDVITRKKIDELYSATHLELRENQPGMIYKAVKKIADSSRGKIKALMHDMMEDLTSLEPDVYHKHSLIRKNWGVPNHYIAFRR